jgi:Cdc6-like AAA superfamily ATPase
MDLMEAMQQSKKDRVATFLSTAPGHLKVVCAALAKLTYHANNLESSWHSTSSIYEEYKIVLDELADTEDTTKKFSGEWDESWAAFSHSPLSYGRMSDRLIELKNAGLVEAQGEAKGSGGNRMLYRLVGRPEVIGETISQSWWSNLTRDGPVPKQT